MDRDQRIRLITDRMDAWPSFHTFRHTCASLLFDNGKNVKQVAEWLGHADPAFTLRTYVHLLDEGLGNADFLDGMTSGARSPTRELESAAAPTSEVL